MKIFTKKELLPISLIIFIILVSFFIYPQLPERVPSHWNAQGEIDDWSSREFTVFFFPSVIVGIYILMILVPLIDPLRRNYEKFAVPYFWFRTMLVIFFVLLYVYTIFAAQGEEFNINYFIIPAVSLLFIAMGLFMPKIKKNYFVGIRTPWTIHSEEVWDKTHRAGGKFFVAAGIIMLGVLIFPSQFPLFFISAIFVAALAPVVYSYFIFKKTGGFNNNSEDLFNQNK